MAGEIEAESGFELSCPAIPSCLAPFVSSWVGYREWSTTALERFELPRGRAILIFEFAEPILVGRSAQDGTSFHTGFFAGIDDLPAWTRIRGTQAGIEVELTARGALAFTRLPQSEVARRVIDLRELGVANSLRDQLATVPDWNARFAIITEFLTRRFEGAAPLSELVQWAIERVDSRKGLVRIDRLSAELGYSRKHLHERFVREIGLPPKRYAALRRFSQALDRLRSGPRCSFAQLALELGYADQSHLARDIRRFAGRNLTYVAQAQRDPIAQAIAELTSAPA